MNSEIRWLTVNQIRQQQRCRKEKVLDAMNAGILPYEQRGRVRYARSEDVEKWELSRIGSAPAAAIPIMPNLARFV